MSDGEGIEALSDMGASNKLATLAVGGNRERGVERVCSWTSRIKRV